MTRPKMPRQSNRPDPYPQPDPLPVPAPDPPPEALLSVPDDLTPDEGRAFEEMRPALRAVVVAMRDLTRDEMVGLLDSRYALGEIVLEIKSDPARYGALSDIQMAAFFGEGNKGALAEARRIRERYPPERFAAIKAAFNPANGARISYSHLAILLRFEDPAQADKALDTCLQEGLGTKELSRYVTKRLRELDGKESRPPRSRPANFVGMVENVTAVTQEFRR
ncbi:MAG TPA: hypothetical protein VFW33_21300, partial [Gemmataceae bacterium]|nr:hypothetical protein [Gemmataceae bacterium]